MHIKHLWNCLPALSNTPVHLSDEKTITKSVWTQTKQVESGAEGGGRGNMQLRGCDSDWQQYIQGEGLKRETMQDFYLN